MSALHHGFFRVAAVSPRMRVGDCEFNASEIISCLTQCEQSNVQLAVFPEMSLCGYTCSDLFHQSRLIQGCIKVLHTLVTACRTCFKGLVIVGLPHLHLGRLYNVAAVIYQGAILGFIPKSFLPNYNEFYDCRYFSPASTLSTSTTFLFGCEIPFGTDLLFRSAEHPEVTIGVEICEDLWTPIPPSSLQALAGATIHANLTASPETTGKVNYRRHLVENQSGRCLSGYIYAASGPGESTTDLLFGGHCLIAENATILAESKRFHPDSQIIIADLDIQRLIHDRIGLNSFHPTNADHHRVKPFRIVPFSLPPITVPSRLYRPISPNPFVPSDPDTLRDRCEEIFHIQSSALAKRLDHIGRPDVVIGISGGLDSTLALLAVCKTFDDLQLARHKIIGITMPGFGTTIRTKSNSLALMSALGLTAREIDIRDLCLQQMRALGHAPFGISLEQHTVQTLTVELAQLPPERRSDLVFENIQARTRTSILMNSGFVIGTGDLSELALGWCTYNADQMSMYNPNVSIPKTLVKFLVNWAADQLHQGTIQAILHDILATEISPELLPITSDGHALQSTESIIGPYELHDFFLYHFLRYGCSPEKILFLASHTTFQAAYTMDVIKHWLKVFLTRFFNNQFKRSCMPDGPKVGSVSLSPRGDWRMPSDAVATLWLKALDPD